jgi:hypothetical protein
MPMLVNKVKASVLEGGRSVGISLYDQTLVAIGVSKPKIPIPHIFRIPVLIKIRAAGVLKGG